MRDKYVNRVKKTGMVIYEYHLARPEIHEENFEFLLSRFYRIFSGIPMNSALLENIQCPVPRLCYIIS